MSSASPASAVRMDAPPGSSNMSHPASESADRLDTSHGCFIASTASSGDSTGTSSKRQLVLRGVNLSGGCKVPRSHPIRSSHAGGSANRESAPPDRIFELHSGPAPSDPAQGQAPAPTWTWRTPPEGRAKSHLKEGFWEGMEMGGEEGWYAGAPMRVEGCEVHLRRLRGWGFNVVRYVVVWEALEHAGPGKYDETFIRYTIDMLRKLKEFGFRVFIDPHQDIWSRATGGSGAPIWTLHAAGLNPRRFMSTGAAYIHSQWSEDEGGPEGFPDMIWQTNGNRLAARTMFTLFFAGETFAPRCEIDSVNIQRWLQDHHNAAYAHLAEAIRDAGDLFDVCVIGWDSMNEPSEGFVGVPDLGTFPPSQSFKKGPSPTPIQGFRLGVGRPQTGVETHDFSSFGPKKTGSTDLSPDDARGCWLDRDEAEAIDQRWGWTRGSGWNFWDSKGENGCIWAGHGVWSLQTGDVLRKDYFTKRADGTEVDFLADFWLPHWAGYVRSLRRAHPGAIWFANPPVFAKPPDIAEEIHGGRFALSHHFYDGMTMLDKHRHLYNADAVAVTRGLAGMFKALKFGQDSIRASMRQQLGELKGDAGQDDSAGHPGEFGRYPVLIGEMGVPFDMRPTAILGLAKGSSGPGDYKESAKVLDNMLNACDGDNALNLTIWNYEVLHEHKFGDGWNGENLSLWSSQDSKKQDDSPPANYEELLCDGARAIQAFCRPFPVNVAGTLLHSTFDIKQAEFTVKIMVPGKGSGHPLVQSGAADGACETVFYLPFVHFRRTIPVRLASDKGGEQSPVLGQTDDSLPLWSETDGQAVLELGVTLSEGKFKAVGQYGYWYHGASGERDRELTLSVRRWGGSLWKAGGPVDRGK